MTRKENGLSVNSLGESIFDSVSRFQPPHFNPCGGTLRHSILWEMILRSSIVDIRFVNYESACSVLPLSALLRSAVLR